MVRKEKEDMITAPPDPPSDSSNCSPSGKREMILEAALRLFTTHGFHATPTALISKEAGISTGTLFHYFPDKNALFDQLYLSIKREIAGVMRKNDDPDLSPIDRLERYFKGFVSWGMANPEKIRFLEQFYHSPNIGEEVKDEVYHEFAWVFEISKAAMDNGSLPKRPPEFFSVMFSQILFGLLQLIRSGRTGLSAEDLTEYSLIMMRKG